MEFCAETLDDVLMCLYKNLLGKGASNTASRGETKELLGVALRIQNPRARLSRSENRGKLFSALGELLWYLSGKNDLAFIKRYIPAYEDEVETDGTIYGGYGPRLFSMRNNINQIESIINLLKKKPPSRRAVIQLFNAEDINTEHKDVPCTTTIQFFQREDKLHMAVTLRSNDACMGLPHDVFCFTMIQEMIARKLGVELGEYYQYVGSMHLYECNINDIKAYMNEGFQTEAEMPPMPEGDPFEDIKILLDCEQRIRNQEHFSASDSASDPYWADIIRLLQVFLYKNDDRILKDLLSQFNHSGYRPYVEARLQMRNSSLVAN